MDLEHPFPSSFPTQTPTVGNLWLERAEGPEFDPQLALLLLMRVCTTAGAAERCVAPVDRFAWVGVCGYAVLLVILYMRLRVLRCSRSIAACERPCSDPLLV